MIAAGARQKPEPASQSTTIGEWAVSAGRWQDHLGLLLGVRAALSPIAFRFTHDVAAAVGAIAGATPSRPKATRLANFRVRVFVERPWHDSRFHKPSGRFRL